ncbi:response regulator [uncultured Pseudoalteromonas sp.]|uniref:response regulator n=1 Tax=uncultured Pseudoalteromonas sp. TaxID=114053 RepID=UPI0025986106|nr:response regulator [uncultured Pseudoalteromonas sp.]|tara:strand:+ start:2902 stop:4539 length:1638 start_codon:yes stop_codon:yes gene_type:complete
MSFLEDKYILVVDDSNLILSAIKLLLLKEGAQSQNIVLAKDSYSTVKACNNQSFDFIIFDYNLGDDEDGLQLLAYLTMGKLIPNNCVVLIVSAEQSREVVQGFTEWEPDGYFVKPFNMQSILPRMHACYRKKAAFIELESCYLKYGFELANQQLNKSLDTPYYTNYKVQLLTWDGQTSAANKIQKQLILQGDEDTRLSYAKWLLNAGDLKQAHEVVQPLLAIPRFRLAALELSANACLVQGLLQQAHDFLLQMNKLAPDNPKRLLIQFNIAVILNNKKHIQKSAERYHKVTQQLSWLNIDCHFNLLRFLVSQIERLSSEAYTDEFKRLQATYINKRYIILIALRRSESRTSQLHEIKPIVDARYALCHGDLQPALKLIEQYRSYSSYEALPFYCQLDMLHLYRKLSIPLPDFIQQVSFDDYSQQLLFQHTLRLTHTYQQQLETQLRNIETAENNQLYAEAVSITIKTIETYGMNLPLAKMLIHGFIKGIPLDIPQTQLKYCYFTAKRTLMINKNQFQSSDIYVNYCRYLESTISFLKAESLVNYD